MKLIFSMPGVPSATPAQENSASTGPPHSSMAASIEAVSARSTWIAFDAGQRDLGEVHDHDLGAGVLHQLGGAAPMPVAPPTTSARLPSYGTRRTASCHVLSSADLRCVDSRRRRRGP